MEKHHHIKIASTKKPGPRSVCESTLPLPVVPKDTKVTSAPAAMPPPTFLPHIQQPNIPALPAFSMDHHTISESEKNIPVPVLCAQLNSYNDKFAPQAFSAQPPEMNVEFDDQAIPMASKSSPQCLSDATMPMQPNIPVAVLDEVLQPLDS